MKIVLCLGLFIFSAVNGMRLREGPEGAEGQDVTNMFSIKNFESEDESVKATTDAIKEIRDMFIQVHDPEGKVKFTDEHLLALSELDIAGFQKHMGEMFDPAKLLKVFFSGDSGRGQHKRESASGSKSGRAHAVSVMAKDWFDHNKYRDAAEKNKKVNWANLDCTCPAFWSAKAWQEGGHVQNQQNGGTLAAARCDDRADTSAPPVGHPYVKRRETTEGQEGAATEQEGAAVEKHTATPGAAYATRTSRAKYRKWQDKGKVIWDKREEGGRIPTKLWYAMAPHARPQATPNTGAAFVRKMARTSRAATDDYLKRPTSSNKGKIAVEVFNKVPIIPGVGVNIFSIMYYAAPTWEKEAKTAKEAENFGIGNTAYMPPKPNAIDQQIIITNLGGYAINPYNTLPNGVKSGMKKR